MKRRSAMLLAVMCIIFAFSACSIGRKQNETVIEYTDSMIVYKQGQCSPVAGIMVMDFTLDYTGPAEVSDPSAVTFSVKANDGLFYDRAGSWFEEKDDCTSDGEYYWQWFNRENAFIENGEVKFKDENSERFYTGDGIYIEVIAKDGDNILGYTVSKLYPFLTKPASEITDESKGDERIYAAVEIESRAFPMMDGKYQDISEQFVQELIDATVAAGADTIPEGFDDLLANESK